jgi:DNA-directed RNA polymerase sigma subunit (sigma70/sigma32)
MHQALPSIAYNPERSLIVQDAVASMMDALNSIKNMNGEVDTRNIAVLKHYYGLEGGEPSTLDETARHFGVTRERVRQIIMKVERQIRRKFNQPRYEDAKSAMLEMIAP